MLGWLVLALAGVVVLLLAGLVSWVFGRSHFGVKRSTNHHVGENEAFYRRPH
jgi:multisubunit Na+/H+ antiporter MnhB subunit